MTSQDETALEGLAARGVALARVGIGVVATLAPATASQLQFGSAPPGQVAAVRMLGARDLALGLGALLAAGQGGAGFRGWVEAGALVDAVDAVAFLRSPRNGGVRRRRFTALVAGSSAILCAWAARRLGDLDQHPVSARGRHT